MHQIMSKATIWKRGFQQQLHEQIMEWYNHFKDGRTSVESEVCYGRHSTSRNDEIINQIQILVMQNSCTTI